MTRYPTLAGSPAIAILWIAILGVAAFVFQSPLLGEPVPDNGPAIECLLPDGQISTILRSANDEAMVSCPLRAGETTFIIPLAANAKRDRLTFVNENAAATGQLKIAVSDSRLPVTSSKWTPVEGTTPFFHKRFFNVSLLGIETKFVRLSFRVDGSSSDARLKSTAIASR